MLCVVRLKEYYDQRDQMPWSYQNIKLHNMFVYTFKIKLHVAKLLNLFFQHK